MGIDVYADVVINHMANQPANTTGRDGTVAGARSFPTTYNDPCTYFHHNTSTCMTNCQMNDTSSAFITQFCDLGLPGMTIAAPCTQLASNNSPFHTDLATADPHVRDQIAGYLQSLLDLGVAGFRVDAGKHIPAEDMAAILNKTTNDARVYYEFSGGLGSVDAIQESDYFGTGDVQEFKVGRRVIVFFFLFVDAHAMKQLSPALSHSMQTRSSKPSRAAAT